MPNFNYDEYFANKLKQLDSTDKKTALELASESKVAKLVSYAKEARIREANLAAEKEASKNSWVTKLGLNPDSATGSAVNLAASVAYGTGRGLGHIGSLPVSALAAASTAGATEKDYADYNTLVTTGNLPEGADINKIGGFKRAEQLRTVARKVNDATDIMSVVHQGNRNQLNNELGDDFQASWDKVTSGWESGKQGKSLEATKGIASGLAGLVYNAGQAAINNKMGVAEYIAENAPQLLIGTAGKVGQVALGMSNVGYAMDTYQKGLENYASKNQGALPPEELRNTMAMQAASLAVAEHVMDAGNLSLIKSAGDAAKTSFKQSLKNIGSAGAGGFGGEFITEGYQTRTEGEIKGEPVSAKEVYQGAVIGGLSGGGLTGGGRAVAEVLKATPEHAQERKSTAVEVAEIEKAVVDNSHATFSDPESPSYDPKKAVAVMLGHAQLETTPLEVKQSNLEEAAKVIEVLTAKQQEAEKLASRTIAPNPEKEEEVHAYSTVLEELHTNPESPTYQSDVEQVTALKNAALDIKDTELSPAEIKANTAALAAINKDLATANDLYSALTETVKGATTATEIRNDIQLANTTPDVNDPVAVEATSNAVGRIIRLSMKRTNTALDMNTANELASNMSNSLTEPQRAQLRVFSAARVAENQLKNGDQVAKDIYEGRAAAKKNAPRHKGLNDYQNEVSSAVEAGNKNLADKAFTEISNFEESHVNKAAALAKALEKGPGTQIHKVAGSNEWVIAEKGQELEDAALKANGGAWASKTFVDTVAIEAKAIQAISTEMASLYQSKFNVSPKKVSSTSTLNSAQNVQNTPTIPSTGELTGVQANAQSQATTPQAGKESTAGTNKGSVAGTTGVNSVSPTAETPLPVNSKLDTTAEALSRVENGALSTLSAEQPSEYTNHSGGAYGADTLWDLVGRAHGVTNHNHYREEKNSGLSAKLRKNGVKAVTVTQEALETGYAALEKATGKKFERNLQNNLKARNHYQVSNSDSVFAIAEIKQGNVAVRGGTDAAVQMAIKAGKPVNVWDTNTQKWHKWDGSKFQLSDTPILTKNYAGIGTRDIENYNVFNKETNSWAPRAAYKGAAIEAAATQAIKDVYEKTFKQVEKEPTPVVTKVTSSEQPAVAPAKADVAEDVAPWEDAPARVTSSKTLKNLQNNNLDRTLQEPNTQELAALSKALAKLQGIFSKEIASVSFLVQKDYTAGGTFYADEMVIGIRDIAFTTPAPLVSDTVEENVLRILTHELTHVRDRHTGFIDTSVAHRLVYESERAKTLNLGGKLYEEAAASMTKGTPEQAAILQRWFGYIINGNLKSYQVPRELYAQLYTLYFMKPELMNEILPQASRVISRNIAKHKGMGDAIKPISDRTGSNPAIERQANSGKQTSETNSSGNGTPTRVAPWEDAAAEVKESIASQAVAAIVKASKQLLSTASKQETEITPDAEFLTENADVTVLLKLLGLFDTEATSSYIYTPSEKDILLSQAEVLRAIDESIKDPTTTEANLAGLVGKFSWHLSDTVDTNDLPTEATKTRRDRAQKSASKHAGKHANGDIKTHYLIQLAEELNELHTEAKRISGGAESQQSSIQKRAFKVLRFGADTIIKDGPFMGKTNGEVFTKLTNKESTSRSVEDTALLDEAVAMGISTKGTMDEIYERVQEAHAKKAHKDAIPDGRLTLFDGASDPDLPYNKKHLIRDFLKQVSQYASLTSNPLVEMKNFFTELRKDRSLILKYLGQDSLTGSQESLVTSLLGKAKEWDSHIANLFNEKTDFPQKNLNEFFINEDGSVDENVKTAISTIVFSKLGDMGKDPFYNTYKDINSILGMDKDSLVTDKAKELLGQVTNIRTALIQDMGKDIVKAIGLTATDNTPVELLPNIEVHMGTIAVSLMINMGYVTERKISDNEWMGMLGARLSNDTDSDREAAVDYVKDHSTTAIITLNRTAEKNNITADSISEVSKDTGSLLNKLFDVTTRKTEPLIGKARVRKGVSSRRAGKASPRAKGTTKELNEILDASDDAEWGLNGTMFDLISAMYKQDTDNETNNVLSIMGFDSREEHTIHKSKRIGVRASNEGLQRELSGLFDFVNGSLTKSKEGLKSAIRFQHDVWIMGRVGIKSSVDPQASKFHRGLFSRPSWTSKVSMSNMTQFNLRVAEGFGIKTEREFYKDVMRASLEIQNSPTVTAAIEALGDYLLTGELSEDASSAIAEGVASGKENTHTLVTLLALAQYRNAAIAGDTEFEVTLMGEVDGVNNGPMFTNLLLGAADGVNNMFRFINRGGFFKIGSEVKDFNQWRGLNKLLNQDLYENTIGRVLDVLGRSAKTEASLNVGKAISYFSGNLRNDKTKEVSKEGRKIVKRPLTAIHFSATTESAIEGMFGDFIESVYSKIEKVYNEKDTPNHSERFTELRGFLRTIGLKLDDSATIEGLQENTLSNAEMRGISKVFSNSMGVSVEEVITSDFKTYIQRRNAINGTARISSMIYKSVRNAAFAKAEDNITDRWTNSKGKTLPMHGLTRAEEKVVYDSLKGVEPVVHTAMSKDSNDLSAGIFIGDGELRTMRDNRLYDNEVKLGTTVKSSDTRSMSTYSKGYVDIGPGVRMLPFLIHGFDSMVSHYASRFLEVLNIHDAHGVAWDKVVEAAQNLNKATWKALLIYSPAKEMSDAYLRTVHGVADMIQMGTLPEGAIASMLEDFSVATYSIKNVSAEDYPMHMATKAVTAAADADTIRLRTLAQMGHINQYSTEGGAYAVTKEDREAAENALRNVTTLLTEKDILSLNILRDALVKESTKERGPVAEKDSVSAPLGKPKITPDSNIVKRFGNQGTIPVGKIHTLYNYLLASSPANKQLLMAIRRKLPSNLVLRLITNDTSKSVLVGEGPKPGEAGWFEHDKEGGNTITILGPEYADSAITPELLVHELLHAALNNTIGWAEANKSSREYEALVNLEKLLKEANQFIKDNALGDRFKEQLSNVDELISWGLTNKDFQDTVLKAMTFTPAVKSKSFLSMEGLSAFVNSLVTLIFGREVPSANTGMLELITNASVLIQSEAASDNTSRVVRQTMTINPDTGLKSYNTEDIFDGLAGTSNNGATVSPKFEAHLKQVLSNIVDNVYGPYGAYKEAFMSEKNVGPADVYAEALASGNAPHAADAMSKHIGMTDQEAFVFDQVEAVIRAGIDTKGGTTRVSYRKLDALFTETKARLTPADFDRGDAAAAKAMYDFIFKVDLDSEGVSHHLSRFAAMGLANEWFNGLLNAPTKGIAKVAPGAKVQERLQNILETILDWIDKQFMGTFSGQAANQKLILLMKDMVKTDRGMAARLGDIGLDPSGISDKFDSIVDTKREAIKKKLEAFADLPYFKNHKSSLVKASAALVSTYSGHRIKHLLNTFEDFRNAHHTGQHGVVAALFNEQRGARDLNMVYHMMLRKTKKNENERHSLVSHYSSFLMGSFVEGGELLTKEDKAAMTQVFLRSDLQVLMGANNDVKDIANLLRNSTALNARIAAVESKLKSSTDNSNVHNFYVNSAKALGFQMTKERYTTKHVLLNAGNIAKTHGNPLVSVSVEQAAIAEPLIDELASLYAVSYTDTEVLKLASSVLAKENARTDGGNGIAVLLATHKDLQTKAKDKIFSGNNTQMIKGYTPEVLNPYKTMEVIELVSAQTITDMEAKGFKYLAPLSKASNDPRTERKGMFVRRDGGLLRYVSGVTSTTSLQSKGESVHSGELSALTATGKYNMNIMKKMQSGSLDSIRMMMTSTTFDPRKVTETFAAPLLNDQGDVVNYRYGMSSDVRNETMNRDNRPEHLLGLIAGNTFDKVSSAEQNKLAVQALHDHYKKEFHLKSNAYLVVGPDSTDPQLREIYARMPESMKEAVRDIWGTDTMRVRVDVLDLLFGYRKLSLSTAFSREEIARDTADKIIVAIGKFVFKDKAELRVRQIEDGLEEIMKMIKANLVIRSWSTMSGNIRSNVTALLIMGMSPIDIIKHMGTALKGAWEHRKDSKALFELQQQLSSNILVAGNTKAGIEEQILRLEDRLKRNPVTKLIDAGMMPSIVEDIETENDIYTRKSELREVMDKHINKLPSSVVTAGKFLLMTEDSSAYKAMSYVTQVSDFLARYALYEHVTTRKENPLTHEKAIQQASDLFINYDIPTHRTIQYMNDHGFLMFTKYYVRIQKMIGLMFKEHPGRVVAMAAATNNSVLSASMFNPDRFGRNPLSNPLDPDLPFNSIGEIATMKLLGLPF